MAQSLCSSHTSESTDKGGSYGVIDPDYQGGNCTIIPNGAKGDHVCNREDPLGNLLVFPCPITKVNLKLQQSRPGRTTNGLDCSGIMV